MKIALNNIGGENWTGGITYINNLIYALNTLQERPTIYLLSKDNQAESRNIILLSHNFSESWIVKKYDAFSRHFLRKDYITNRILKGNDIDVLFPGKMSVGRQTASIFWIPDFQFLHLPYLYSANQIVQLRKKLQNNFKDVPIIILSSKDALADLIKFAPQFIDKTRILNFVAHVPDDLYSVDTRLITSLYHLPDDFIYLPNQFWAHKNHNLVLEALKILKDSVVRPIIVCSGNPVDSRDPLYFAGLMKKISEYDLRDQFLIIGLIPHDHIYSLIRQSKCVLNPSLFEGWSTTVEESKSVGKRMILSDLNVHREQDPPEAIFFKRNDATDLAEKLKEAWLNFKPGPDLALEDKARKNLPVRMKVFAETFMAICEEAIQIVRC